mmetsp:Transcript_13992/g.42316  ORF Transcript_13992/g.42316 Transcript_13992/m.42316 type:complete len:271 (-) Transcript_13992:23-835(-)
MASWQEKYRSWEAWSLEQQEDDSSSSSEKRSMYRMCTGCRGLDRTEERRVFELPTREKVRCCRVYEKRGDALYWEGQFFRASLWYRRSLAYYEYSFPETPDDVEALDRTRVDVLLGLARCDLRNRLFRDVLNHCYQALQLDVSDRVLLLRAAAYRSLDAYDEAFADLDACPPGPDKQRELAKLRARQAAYALRSRDQCRRIVQGLGRFEAEEAPVFSDATEERRSRLLARATAVVPAVTARERDALDDLATPVDTLGPLRSLLLRRRREE